MAPLLPPGAPSLSHCTVPNATPPTTNATPPGVGPRPAANSVAAAISVVGCEGQRTILVGSSTRDLEAGAAAGCLFSVAVYPTSKPLPAGLAGAACRINSVDALAPVLAEAGVRALARQPSVHLAASWSIDPTASEAAALQAAQITIAEAARLTDDRCGAHASELGPEIDWEIVRMVEAMSPSWPLSSGRC